MTRGSVSSRNFVHVAPSVALEVCLTLSLHQKVLIRLHAHLERGRVSLCVRVSSAMRFHTVVF